MQKERATISRRKSKTTEAVANRGVDADAPCGEKRRPETRRMKTPRCTEDVKHVKRRTALSRRKDVYSEKKEKTFPQSD